MSSSTVPAQPSSLPRLSGAGDQALDPGHESRRRSVKPSDRNHEYGKAVVAESSEKLFLPLSLESMARSAESLYLPAAPKPLRRSSSRIAVRSQRTISFIDAREIVSVEAQANYVIIHQRSSNLMVRESISKIAEKLRPYGLLRIHRSHLVNVAMVEEIRPLSTGEYRLQLREGKAYIVSRRYKGNLRLLADVWCGVRAGILT